MRSLAVHSSILIGSLVLWAHPARADVVYSNLQTPQPQTIATVTWWDDAQIVGGGPLESFRMVAFNARMEPHIYEATVRIHLFDTANDSPDGPLLGEFTITSATPMAAAEARLLESPDLSALNILLPQDSRLSIEFDFPVNFGVVLYDPPTIGSSEDPLWRFHPPKPHPILDVAGNTGIELITVPEPSVMGGAILLAAWTLWARKGHVMLSGPFERSEASRGAGGRTLWTRDPSLRSEAPLGMTASRGDCR